jgi:2-oxo-4-hydroxy-4-carboxy-5-ureidoimidazoline decarboxylase
MHLAEFNRLDRDQARRAIEPCLGVSRWADEVVDARPYDDLAALVAQASASAQHLSDDELASALGRHPRIGERPDGDHTERGFSRHEQSAVDSTDAVTAERLRDGNKRYEERFDRVFLIRASGRSGKDILSELERRLDHDDESERREVVQQLREIALLRLDQVVTP